MSIIVHIGKPGSFSHAAAREQYGIGHTYMGCVSFEEVFRMVSDGHAELGVIPLENSLAGSIYENYDLFNKYMVHIAAEQYLKVEHYLLAKKSVRHMDAAERMKNIREVYSHPKALEQCRSFFALHPWMKSTMALDTASAAHTVAQGDNLTIAAIGSKESAHLYRLEILASHIEDDSYNYTRFVYIQKNGNDGMGGNKCSLQFEVAHKPGSLVEVLQILKNHKFNMTKIESRPIHGRPFEYRFYLDFEFSKDSAESMSEVMEQIRRHCLHIKILGMYEAGTLV